jgi:Site-specific recombinase XerD
MSSLMSKEMQFLDAEQSAAMLRAAEGTCLYLPLLLALGTGMRRGELLALRWHDVDLDGGTLVVARTVEEAFDKLSAKEPKTTKSRRRITLPGVVVDALRAERTEQAKKTLASQPGESGQNLVLLAPDGDPWWPSNFDRTWRRSKKRQGLTVRFHDLRHTHATQLLKAGVHVKIVSERLGHASVGITLDTYSHCMPALQQEAAEKIDVGLRAALAG